MNEMKELSLSDIRRDITSSSGNTGRDFGILGRFPVVKEISGHARYPCGNDQCPAREVRFDHRVNRISGELESHYSWNKFEFLWDPELDEFKVTGHYCPICGRLSIEVDGETVEEQEGEV